MARGSGNSKPARRFGPRLMDYEGAALYLCTTPRPIREPWAQRTTGARRTGAPRAGNGPAPFRRLTCRGSSASDRGCLKPSPFFSAGTVWGTTSRRAVMTWTAFRGQGQRVGREGFEPP